MRKLFPLAILAFALTSLLSLQVSAATPAAPTWIPAEEYVVFPGETLYEDASWTHIQTMRDYAANGGNIFDLRKSPVAGSYNAMFEKHGSSYAFKYEMRLIFYKLGLNRGAILTEPERTNFSLNHPSTYKGYAKLSERERYALNLWSARTNLRPFPQGNVDTAYIGFGSHYASIKYLVNQPAFTPDKVYGHDSMQLYDPALVEEYRSLILVLVNDTYFASPYPVLKFNRDYSHMDYAKLVGDRTMVPIRFLAEPLGLTVDWDEATQTVSLSRDGTEVVLVADSDTATVNGKTVSLDAAAFVENGRTYVPLRFVSEQLGATVSWDGSKNLVRISTKDPFLLFGSNLHQWAVPMGSILNSLNADYGFSGTCFGVLNQTPYHADHKGGYGAYWYTPPADQSTKKPHFIALATLNGSWGVSSREGLISTVLALPTQGHNVSFREMADFRNGLTDAEYKAILASATEMDAYMLPFTEQLAKKWGDKGILAWDLLRVSNLVQWGVNADLKL